MAKFNRGAGTAAFSVIASKQAEGKTTEEGGKAFKRDAKSELFLLAVNNFVGEDTFYEDAKSRDSRFEKLIAKVAVKDPKWTYDFLTWLRLDANMRSASIAGSAIAVHALLESGYSRDYKQSVLPIQLRYMVCSVLIRADEPGEYLAFWISKYGKNVPQPVKRGIADAVALKYNQFNYLKWDSSRSDIRFSDVINLVHPTPDGPNQSALFKYILDDRYGKTEVQEGNIDPADPLAMVKVRAQLNAASPEKARGFLIGSEALIKKAGVTWEYLSGLGKMDKEAWETVIPNMGYMALMRNLRNFDQSGIDKFVMKAVAEKLQDPEQVAKSRQLPMRFLSAYNAAENDFWKPVLQEALDLSLGNVPTIKVAGSMGILIDVSGSMSSPFGRNSSLQFWEAAALFGIALAKKVGNAYIYAFDGNVRSFELKKGANVLAELSRFRKDYYSGGGTNTVAALETVIKNHNPKAVTILTDEQYAPGNNYYWYGGSHATIEEVLPAKTDLFMFNLAGYKYGSAETGKKNIHAVGGLSDKAFDMLALTINHDGGRWPWEKDEAH